MNNFHMFSTTCTRILHDILGYMPTANRTKRTRMRLDGSTRRLGKLRVYLLPFIHRRYFVMLKYVR